MPTPELLMGWPAVRARSLARPAGKGGRSRLMGGTGASWLRRIRRNQNHATAAAGMYGTAQSGASSAALLANTAISTAMS